MARYLQLDQPTQGWETAVGTMATHLQPVGPWTTDDEQGPLGFERQSATWIALATIAATAVLGGLAARRDRPAGHLALVALAGVALGLVSTARITGELVPFVIGYWRPIAALTYVSIGFSAVTLVADRRVALGTSIAAVAVTGVVAIVAIAAAPHVDAVPTTSTALGGLGPATARALRHGDRYLLEGQDPETLNGTTAGLLLYLEARGFRVFHEREPLAALRFGRRRIATPAAVDRRLILASHAASMIGWRPPPGARRVAAWDPLDRAQRGRATRLEALVRLGARIAPNATLNVRDPAPRVATTRAGARRADVDTLGRLQRAGDAYAVYETRP
jgi:hypothetical protein